MLSVIGLTFLFDTAAFLIGVGVGWRVDPDAAGAQHQPEEVVGGVIGGTLVTVIVSVAFVTSFVDVFQDHQSGRPGCSAW